MEDQDLLSNGAGVVVGQKRVEYVIDNNLNSIFDGTKFVFVIFSTSGKLLFNFLNNFTIILTKIIKINRKIFEFGFRVV